MTLLATLDGVLHPIEQPFLRADDLGVQRGDGVFETVLTIDGHPRDLTEHLIRLAASAALIDLPIPAAAAWRRGVDAVLAAWAQGRECAVKLVATRGVDGAGETTGFVTAAPVAESSRRQRLGTSVLLLDRGFAGPAVAAAPWLLPGAKTLSYAINMAAIRYAKANGADDVVFVGSDGTVLEGATAAVVLARGRTLTTPPPDGILPSITCARLFRAAAGAGFATSTAPITPADLLEAEGVWLVSSVRLLAPVRSIDGMARPAGPQQNELAALLELP